MDRALASPHRPLTAPARPGAPEAGKGRAAGGAHSTPGCGKPEAATAKSRRRHRAPPQGAQPTAIALGGPPQTRNQPGGPPRPGAAPPQGGGHPPTGGGHAPAAPAAIP